MQEAAREQQAEGLPRDPRRRLLPTRVCRLSRPTDPRLRTLAYCEVPQTLPPTNRLRNCHGAIAADGCSERDRRYPEVASTNRQFRGIRKAQILLDGTQGVQFVGDLRPEPHEMVVTKKRLSAAFDTELPVLLRSFLPEEVVRLVRSWRLLLCGWTLVPFSLAADGAAPAPAHRFPHQVLVGVATSGAILSTVRCAAVQLPARASVRCSGLCFLVARDPKSLLVCVCARSWLADADYPVTVLEVRASVALPPCRPADAAPSCQRSGTARCRASCVWLPEGGVMR